MRYVDTHKPRRRILDAAGRRMKSSGIDNSGLSPLMNDQGLTKGAFYARVSSKSDLIAATVADQLETQRATIEALVGDIDALTAYIRYACHRRAATAWLAGCPSAAILS